ncbi:hypothetical protein R3I93_016613 [Phoxinus phoxinus]|uniref:Uncharacterized protein n=1 Tax=Phoxinus phoxinus TaxID=58324 RepID=A0AAN9H158_9TELE
MIFRHKHGVSSWSHWKERHENNGENEDYKAGKVLEHHDVVASTYSSELRHASRNYSQIWAVVTGDVENMCFCRATETHGTFVIFISERKNRIGSYLRQHFL